MEFTSYYIKGNVDDSHMYVAWQVPFVWVRGDETKECVSSEHMEIVIEQ